MKTYTCYHYLCRQTAKRIFALSSFEARQMLAAELGVGFNDIVAIKVGG